MAITARCFIPPESSWGYARSRRSGAAMAIVEACRRPDSSRPIGSSNHAPRTPRRAGRPTRTAGLSDVPGFWNTTGSDVASSRRRSLAGSSSIATVESEAPERDIAGIGDELGNRQGSDRLPGARFADDPDDLASPNGEADITDGSDVAAGRWEHDAQTAGIEHEVVRLVIKGRHGDGHACRRGVRRETTARSARWPPGQVSSPNRLKVSPARTMATPGARAPAGLT